MLAKTTSILCASTALKYSVRLRFSGMLGRWKVEGVAAVNTLDSGPHCTWKTRPGRGSLAWCTAERKEVSESPHR